MEKIFLTGASGYLGSTFLKYQSSNFDIIAFGRNKPKILPKNVSFVQGDLNSVSRDSIGNAKTVVHLAAIKGSGKCTEDPDETKKVNVFGTRNLLKAALEANAERVIFASTYWVYDGIPPFKEDDTPKPSEAYGLTKAESEKDIIASGIDYSILRFSNIFGYGSGIRCDDIVFTFLRRAFESKPILLYNGGENKIDLIEIRDTCYVTAKIINDCSAKGIFNVGTGNGVSIAQIAAVVADVLKTDYNIDVGIKNCDTETMKQLDRFVSIKKLENWIGTLHPRDLRNSVREYAKAYKEHIR